MIHSFGTNRTDSDAEKGGRQHLTVDLSVPPGVKYSQTYACHTGNDSCDQCDNPKCLLPLGIPNVVSRRIISNVVSREDGPGIGNCSNSAADDEEGLQAIGADIGDEAVPHR
ncbi:MAG: hypothetical protein Q9177_000819 [Variospora cf. flavescens]